MNMDMVIFAFLCVWGVVYSSKGFTAKFRVSDFACYKEAGYSFMLTRAFTSIGMVDPNVVPNLVAAKEAGLEFADIYINPCFACPYSPDVQVEKVVNALSDVKYRKIWVMVQLTEAWTSDKVENCEFLKTILRKGREMGKDIGIGTNIRDWFRIMGPGCEIVQESVELLYVFHDKTETMGEFEKFGGFNNAVMKEYMGPTRICGSEVNLNVYYDAQKRIKHDL